MSKTNRDVLSTLKSLIADIEAMHRPMRSDEFADDSMDMQAFFGSFGNYYDDDTQEMVEASGDGVRVYWPNLSILLEQAKEVIRATEDAQIGVN